MPRLKRIADRLCELSESRSFRRMAGRDDDLPEPKGCKSDEGGLSEEGGESHRAEEKEEEGRRVGGGWRRERRSARVEKLKREVPGSALFSKGKGILVSELRGLEKRGKHLKGTREN